MKFPLRKLAALFLTAATIQAHTPAASAVTPVHQGDRIAFASTKGRNLCSAGYIDKANSRIWTAGHCAADGVDVFNRQGEHIGKFKHRYPITDESNSAPPQFREEAMLRYQFYDIGYIELLQSDFAGENHFSGDRPYTPEIGEEICRFGATSKTINCGVILRIDEHLIYAIDLNAHPGDSGGPNWVPQKGYVGQTLGTNSIANAEGLRAITTVIHREDLNRQTDHLPTDAPLPENEPSYEELISFDTTVREKFETFGANMPTPSEFSSILRHHEAALKKARREATQAQEALETALYDIELKEKSETEYQAKIKELEAANTKARSELEQVKAIIDMSGIETKDREISRLNRELHDQKRFYTAIATVMSMIIGVIAGFGGWIAHMFFTNGRFKSLIHTR